MRTSFSVLPIVSAMPPQSERTHVSQCVRKYGSKGAVRNCNRCKYVKNRSRWGVHCPWLVESPAPDSSWGLGCKICAFANHAPRNCYMRARTMTQSCSWRISNAMQKRLFIWPGVRIQIQRVQRGGRLQSLQAKMGKQCLLQPKFGWPLRLPDALWEHKGVNMPEEQSWQADPRVAISHTSSTIASCT